jgi:phospholipid/cholesterol/gamma-HCH transport system substrate-binding protein
VTERRTYFLLGLFVIAGVIIGVAAVIWLGASKYLQKGVTYATYFDESVQGLQVDSIVKYRGVDIGTVKQISVAADHRLVEVVMKIEEKGFSVEGVVARLSMAGITGIVYVELDRKEVGQISLVPKDFAPDYPVIPSSPSNIKQIELNVNDILKSIKQIDFKGISEQVLKAGKSIDLLVSSERTKTIVNELSGASVNLSSASEKINKLMASGSVQEVVSEARDALREARSVVEQARTEIGNSGISQVGGKVDRFVEGSSQQVRSILNEVQDTADRLRRTSDSVEILVDRLNADPSALLFSSPPKGE